MSTLGSEQENELEKAEASPCTDGASQWLTVLPAQTLLSTVISTISEGLVVADQSRRLVLFNPAAEKVLGLGLVDVGEDRWSETYKVFLPSGEPCPENQLPLVRALNGEVVQDQHILICRPETETKIVTCNAQRLMDESGNMRGAAIVMRDITAEQKAKEQLEAAISALKRSNNDLEQFATVAAHDLQEPLRSVYNYLELFLSIVPVTGDEPIRYVGKMRAAVKRMQALINALLNYARIETRGKTFAAVDCNSTLENCLENLRASITKKNAQITYEDLPTVTGDPSQIGQVFENLIGNALKFSQTEPKIVISATKKKDRLWEFRVKDNGLGIDPQFHEKIFLIFQRLHTASAYEGTGIGLSVCQKIVERHGGTMRVESSSDKGSTFIFTLREATT